MRYLPLTDSDRAAMLSVIGAPDVDALFTDVAAEQYLKQPIESLPAHASEMAVERHMRRLSKKNLAAADAAFFVGAGAYRHPAMRSPAALAQALRKRMGMACRRSRSARPMSRRSCCERHVR